MSQDGGGSNNSTTLNFYASRPAVTTAPDHSGVGSAQPRDARSSDPSRLEMAYLRAAGPGSLGEARSFVESGSSSLRVPSQVLAAINQPFTSGEANSNEVFSQPVSANILPYT